MKVVTPEILWHGRDPIYSVDFQMNRPKIQRMATCGTDRTIRIWEVKIGKNQKAEVEFLASLNRHTRTVNVVRFSPNGDILASGGDDYVVILWRLNESSPPPANNIFQGDEDEDGKENWTAFKSLRSHLEDVYDLSWSPDSRFLISGSVDNSAIMWDVKKGSRVTILPDHKSFVQGVAFDPLHQYLATMSSDRCCRIFNISSKNCVCTISKLQTTATTPDTEKPKSFRIFHDDTMRSFFRRLTFSPDGHLLIVPAGCLEAEPGEPPANTTYIFTRSNFSRPALHLPGPSKATLAVRCCPTLFELRKIPRRNKSDADGNNNDELKEWEKYETVFCLPYRMVFAVATEDSVLLYDTQQPQPFAYIGNIHYHQLSDVTWTEDGRILSVSSTDGYVTLVTFSEGELGQPYCDQIPCSRQRESAMEQERDAEKEAAKEVSKVHSQPGTPTAHSKESSPAHAMKPPVTPGSHQGQSAQRTPRRVQVTTLSTNDTTPETINTVTPRRVQVTSLSSNDGKSDATKTVTPRRIQVTTLSTNENSTDSCTTSQVTASTPQSSQTTPRSGQSAHSVCSPVTPSGRKDRMSTPRRVQVTTLETYPKDEEVNGPSCSPLMGKLNPVTADDAASPQASCSHTPNPSSSASSADLEINENSLHLQLDTDTAMAPEDLQKVKITDNLGPKPANSKPKARRIQVTTLETFDS